MTQMTRWDKNIDYEYAYSFLSSRFRRTKNKRETCYAAVLLIQLRNGSRISEAIRCFREFLKTNSREYSIKVSKKKSEEYRLMIIPSELFEYRDKILNYCFDFANISEKDIRKVMKKVSNYCINRYRFNTHSLRYSFITYLLRQGVNPAIIAKITHHSRLDYILTYTQQKTADAILRQLV